MKHPKMTKTILAGVAYCLSSTLCVASSGILSVGTSISAAANAQQVMEINQLLPFVVSNWSSLSGANSQGSGFPAANQFAVSDTILNQGTSITNSNNGTLEVRYGPNASGNLANHGYALAPTRVTLRGNTFYVYELPKCFTNIPDSLTSQQAPVLNSVSALMGSSDLGAVCFYAEDPYAAAISAVQGTDIAPQQPSGLAV